MNLETILYSLRNLYGRKTRSTLTIISIFIGIATVFIFISFGLGLYFYVQDLVTGSSADKIMIQARGVGAPGLDESFRIEERDVRAVERTKGVIEASGVYMKVAEVEFGSEKKFAFLVGYDPKKPIILEINPVEMSAGRSLKKGDDRKVVLGYNYQLKDKIFSKPVRLNDKVKIQGKEMRVVGFYGKIGNPQDDSNVYVVDSAINDLYPDKNNSFGLIVARVDIRDVDGTVERVAKSLRKARNQEEGKEDFFVQSFNEMVSTYANILNIIVGFVVLISFISVLVAGINTANTMITSVIERTREIGIIKAIGARNKTIFSLFLFESGFLGAVSGAIGVLAGYGASYFAGRALDNLGWGFLSPAFPLSLFIGCIAFATITGAISGVAPAIRASKINVVDALRYE